MVLYSERLLEVRASADPSVVVLAIEDADVGVVGRLLGTATPDGGLADGGTS